MGMVCFHYVLGTSIRSFKYQLVEFRSTPFQVSYTEKDFDGGVPMKSRFLEYGMQMNLFSF